MPAAQLALRVAPGVPAASTSSTNLIIGLTAEN
jgi:hypothetical protein